MSTFNKQTKLHKEIIKMKNLKLVQKFYASNNTKVEHIYYTDDLGIRNGLFTTFYENGQVKSRVVVINNNISGIYESFYEDGKIKYRCTYNDDFIHGPTEWFYNNGQIKEKGTYTNGKLSGLREEFHKDGVKNEKIWN